MSTATKQRVHPIRRRGFSLNAACDYGFFIFGGISAVWLAWLLLTESFSWGWYQIAAAIVFWLVLAYLVLPRLHRILTQLYVPNYFIGRARTSDGLLGDPINLALLGSEEQLNAAMTAAGWIRADTVTFRSSWRIVTSTILRRSYSEAPVSPLFLFQRQQDVAYQQEMLGNPAKRHHVRFWRCPDGWLLPGGHRADWLAAGTFDRSVGFSLFTLQITHKIDENTDIERDHIVSSLTKSDSEIGVRVISDFSTGYHSRNGGGDTIVTDGDLPVVDLYPVAVPKPSPSEEAAVVAERASVDPVVPVARPLPTTLGGLLMALRTVAGIFSLSLVLTQWPTYVEAAHVEIDGVDKADLAPVVHLFLTVGTVFGALVIVFYFVLTIFVFRGSNWGRITAMSLSALVVLATAIDYFNGGPEISLRANLIGLPLDILVLLALSSERARLWARRLHQKPH